MGVHYVNLALFDETLDVEHPEVLVYEPKRRSTPARRGRGTSRPLPPGRAAMRQSCSRTLMGHLFHFAPGPNRYGPGSVLRAARLGLEGQPARHLLGLEPQGVVCGVGRDDVLACWLN